MESNAAVSLSVAMKIKRESIVNRVEAAAGIVRGNPDDHFILWHDLENERKEIKRVIPSVTEIYGSQDPEIRARTSTDFANGKARLLATVFVK